MTRFLVRFAPIGLILLAAGGLSASARQDQSATSEVTQEEYAIYSSLIKQVFLKPDTKLLVIRERTFRYDSTRGEDDQPWKGKVKGIVIDPSATEDFESKNQQHSPLDTASFKLPVKVVVSTDADLRAIFHGRRGELEWMEYYHRYPDASGLITMSRVGFNTARNQALVYIGSQCGPDCNEIRFFLLEKSGSGWTIRKLLRKYSYG